MTGYVYLLGGGEIGNNETKIIDDFILSNTKIEGNIVFIGAASADSNGYFETFKKVYGDNNTVFITAQFSRDEFSNAILKSRIVYLGGGSTELLQAQLKKWDAHKVFINALKGGTDLVGMSAGAYILSKYYIHEENDTFKVKKGLNLVPLTTQVHSTTKKEMAAYKLLESKNRDVPFIAITERAALVVTGLKTISIGDGYVSRYDFKIEQLIKPIIEI